MIRNITHRFALKFFTCKYFSQGIIPLQALSPLDGRYASQVQALKSFFSEAGLNKYRTVVEIEWLKFLITDVLADNTNTLKKYHITSTKEVVHKIDTILSNFTVDSALKIKEIEKKTNHDVKSVEYYIKSAMKERHIPEELNELVHFCCTSEDINNLAWGLIMKDFLRDLYHPKLTGVVTQLIHLALKNSHIPMMSRTHGQPATPTTVGKEFANYAYRLNDMQYKLKGIGIKGKMNGAVGNYNAHLIVMPNVNWIDVSRRFISKLGLQWNPYTTQIESHDYLSEIFNYICLINTILTGLCRDTWGYISLNYFKQKVKKEEVGSSTMPHKVNPIDFENAEGNLGISNSLMLHMSSKLPISRFQRDLSDSTVLRNIGTAMGHTLIAFNSLEKGMNKIDVNSQMMKDELNSHWELLAEPVQLMMKFLGHKNFYEILKNLTRGQAFSKEEYLKLVESLNIPPDAMKTLLNLKPYTYTGNAEEMAKRIRDFIK